jgi:putative transposase
MEGYPNVPGLPICGTLDLCGNFTSHAEGVSLKELYRRIGISDATFSQWNAKYGRLEVNEARCLRQLADENRRLEKIVAQQALDTDALKVALSTKEAGPRKEREGVRVARDETRVNDGRISSH